MYKNRYESTNMDVNNLKTYLSRHFNLIVNVLEEREKGENASLSKYINTPQYVTL